MDINTLTEKANDLAVARIEYNQAKQELENYLASNETVIALKAKIDALSNEKEKCTVSMLEVMKEAKLKQYKTDYVSISVAKRETIKIDPAVEKELKKRLKSGEEIPNIVLSETEYISIRAK